MLEEINPFSGSGCMKKRFHGKLLDATFKMRQTILQASLVKRMRHVSPEGVKCAKRESNPCHNLGRVTFYH
jgi:hypothetical protein